jgi:hypothetical protein
MDIAQILQDSLVIIPAGKYTTAAAINAAQVRVDTKNFRKGSRALLLIAAENTTAGTTVTVQQSDTIGGALTNVGADELTNPETGAAATPAALNVAAGAFQLLAINLDRCKRYITLTAATNPSTANGAAIFAALIAPTRREG